MGVFRYAREGLVADNQTEAMKSATRLIQASASAASALKRLYGSESRHTVTVAQEKAGEGDTPSPQKSKTNMEEGGYPTPEKSKTNVPNAPAA